MSEIYDDWSNEDSLGGNWWENQSPEEIDDTKFTVLVQGHEHGLGPEAVQRAGIIAAGFDVEFIHWPEEVGKSDLGRGAIVLALHPDKDILHYFPGGEHNYLRYQTDEGDMLRISCAQAILDLMEYSGIPKVDRPTIGKSEAEDIELQNDLLEEKLEHYYESLGRDSKEPSIDGIDIDSKWEVSDEELHKFFSEQDSGGE
jgi:hypothetical protein